MKAVILAAGRGKRMLPLTENCPKALLPINDKITIIDWIVQNCLRAKDIDEVIVVVNLQQKRMFELWNKYDRVKIFVSPIEDNVIACVDYVIDSLKLKDVLIAAADNILCFEIQRFIDFYKEDIKKCAVMYYIEESLYELNRTGVALIEQDVVIEMEEKPSVPKYKNAIPPFYIIPKGQMCNIKLFLRTGIVVDSLGSFLSWYVKQAVIRAYLMPGERYNLGDKESFIRYKKIIIEKIKDKDKS